MAIKDVAPAITRFQENENRVDIFVNAPQNEEFYTTNTDPVKEVETLPHFIQRIDLKASGLFDEIEAEWGWAESVQYLAGQALHLRKTWQVQEAIPSGTEIEMPIWYYPARDMMLMMFNSFPCYPESAVLASQAGLGKGEYPNEGGLRKPLAACSTK